MIDLRAILSSLALAAAPPGAAAADSFSTALPVDQPTTIAGVEVACTGIGQTRGDPRWATYGVRFEFSNGLAEYLGQGGVRLAGPEGAPILSVTCEGPWVLMRLPAGRYTAVGWVPGTSAKPRSAVVTPPSKGQTRFVLQFPDS